MGFKIVKGKLMRPTEEWHKPLEGKVLLLCSSLGNWTLLGIEGDEDLSKFIGGLWDNGFVDEYDEFEDFKDDVSLGNFGFGLNLDEIEVIETIHLQE